MKRTNHPASQPGCRSSHAGFTLVELVAVIALMFTLGAIAMVQLQPLYTEEQANSAMDQVLGQFRFARETAIAQRRNVQVQFIGTNVIQLTRYNLPTGTTILSTLTLQAPVQFLVFPKLPDTPDGFGNAASIYFEGLSGGPPLMIFQSDGTFVDNVGNLVNGTVFLGVTGNQSTARAVTILGATGRIRTYRAPSNGWTQ